MTFEQLQDCFQQRIIQLEELAERTNKRTVLVIQQFPNDFDTEILVPNVRESISNIIAFVELGNLEALEYVIIKADNTFDAIIADIDLKSSFSKPFIDFIKMNVKKSLLFYFNDNAIWADSALNYIQQIENGLFGKSVLLCGEGFLFAQLLLRLLDSGAKVYTEMELDYIQTNSTSKFKICQTNLYQLNRDEEYKRIDFIIGGSIKKTSIKVEAIRKFRNNISMYDIGIGNFPEQVIEIAKSMSTNIFRLDNRAGISALMISLFETNFMITEMMGKVYLKNIEIVAGGIMGSNGSIIVDNAKNPSYIIGIADGKGRVKPNPENETEVQNLNFIQKMINKA